MVTRRPRTYALPSWAGRTRSTFPRCDRCPCQWHGVPHDARPGSLDCTCTGSTTPDQEGTP